MFVKFALETELTHQLVIVQPVCINPLLLKSVMNYVPTKSELMTELVQFVLTNAKPVLNMAHVTPVSKTLSDFLPQIVTVKMDIGTKKETQPVDHVETNVQNVPTMKVVPNVKLEESILQLAVAQLEPMMTVSTVFNVPSNVLNVTEVQLNVPFVPTKELTQPQIAHVQMVNTPLTNPVKNVTTNVPLVSTPKKTVLLVPKTEWKNQSVTVHPVIITSKTCLNVQLVVTDVKLVSEIP
jgi:hypothetical protein